MNWALAMLAALVLLLVQSKGPDWPRQKLRVWAVMFVSWLAGVMTVTLSQRADPVLLFVVIDIIAAFTILWHPRSLAQNIIGCLYVAMIALHVGYVWAASYFLGSAGYANLEKYLFLQVWLGWLQWVVLMIWSASDVGKAIGIRLGIMGHAPPDKVDFGANKR
jgi:hypothetical protein